MSTKTFLRRAVLVVVASLGLGVLTQPSSQGAVVTQSLTLGAATATASTGDTATGSWSVRFTTDSSTIQGAVGGIGDSITVRYSCDAPAGVSCPAVLGRQTATADTANIVVNSGRSPVTVAGAPWVDISSASGLNGWSDSATQGYNVSARSAVSFKATAFPKAGTYTYTFYLVGQSGSAIAGTSTTWTVTVSAPNTSAASIKTSYFAYTNAQADYYRYGIGVPNASSTDSSLVVAT